MATNRADTLDPALLRPGRLDRKIEFPTPDRRQKRLILTTLTGKMNLSEEVDLEDCKFLEFTVVVSRPDKLSGADLASIIQAAGMYAVRVRILYINNRLIDMLSSQRILKRPMLLM
jgi:26S proteasome regulatory subunit T3